MVDWEFFDRMDGLRLLWVKLEFGVGVDVCDVLMVMVGCGFDEVVDLDCEVDDVWFFVGLWEW